MGRKKKVKLMEPQEEDIKQPVIKVKAPKQTHTSITCVDCGAERIIKVQDIRQVTRCVDCQTKYRKLKRKEYRKNRLARLRTQKENLINLAKTHNVPETEVQEALV